MNLHGLAVGVIAAVNPIISLSIQVSTGNTIDPSGKRVPTYDSPVTVPGQVQPLSYQDIQHLDGLNIQGTRRAIYINGRVDGLVRSENKGGDLITVATGVNAGVWLVALISEQWPDWCKALCTLQDGA